MKVSVPWYSPSMVVVTSDDVGMSEGNEASTRMQRRQKKLVEMSTFQKLTNGTRSDAVRVCRVDDYVLAGREGQRHTRTHAHTQTPFQILQMQCYQARPSQMPRRNAMQMGSPHQDGGGHSNGTVIRIQLEVKDPTMLFQAARFVALLYQDFLVLEAGLAKASCLSTA